MTNDFDCGGPRRITRLHEMETREKLRAAKTTNSGRYWHSFPWVVARVPLPFFAAIGPICHLSFIIAASAGARLPRLLTVTRSRFNHLASSASSMANGSTISFGLTAGS